MKIIARPKGQGKTTELIRMAAADKGVAYIVVRTVGRADLVAMMARKMGLNIRFPITCSEVLTHQLGRNVTALYIDDLDDFAQFFVGNFPPIVAATITHTPVLGYICAVCGAPAECALVDLDTGATLTCDECGGKTVVVLQSAEAYTGE
jgi:DNA-directed RNA polymerase subunit RPC12/RpoP